MPHFTVPTDTKSTPGNEAEATLSSIIAEHTAPTGGTLQHPETAGPLAFTDHTVAHYPWLFINHSLPYKRMPETSWVRTNGDISVLFTAPQKFNAHGDLEHGMIPYGRIGREVLMWLVSSALDANSRTIEISRTWRGFLRDLDIPYSAANRAMVQNQLRAILDLSITIHHPGTLAGRNFSTEKFMIGSGEKFTFDKDGLLDDAYRSVVVLSQEFFDRISAEASPVEGSMRILIENWREITRKYPRSPMVGDAFLWLAGRMPRLRGEGAYLPWSALASQFGAATAERDFRKSFRNALRTAAGEYFAPLGPKFDVHTYIEEYGFKHYATGGGLHFSPISPEHQKLLGWGARRAKKSSPKSAKKRTTNHPETLASQSPALAPTTAPVRIETPATVQDAQPEIVEVVADQGVDFTALREELTSNGLDLTAVSDDALRTAVSTVFSRSKSISDPQALAAHSLTKEPKLLGLSTPPPTRTIATAPVPLVTMPKGTCPEHSMDITGKVCSGCAAELKAPDTTAAEAQACWDAVSTRLKSLTEAGFDTTSEMARYQGFAIARGATLSI
ncbi:replication protein RepA [Rothia mucilaginosa]|uniref:replication protein RepA n=1 Tax=Rothia mucilaginosa TaxID=43675 RepID=UPI00288C3B0B|nr:replication protein RepA [Rothia mucilaginosa]